MINTSINLKLQIGHRYVVYILHWNSCSSAEMRNTFILY